MPANADIVELQVAGAIYGGWKSLRLGRGIEQIAGTFEMSVTERWAGQASARPIRPGDPCQVLIGGQPVITGYVDDVRISYDAQDHSVTVSGRDKTGDLVDCSAVYKTGQWSNRRIDQIAADLCAPFGITVQAITDVGTPFATWNIEEGETVFECIERGARMKALLLISDGEGRLLLARAGTGRVGVELVEGQNILRAEALFSWRERFSTYTVKAQVPGNDDIFGISASQVTGHATDSTINRYRPLIVIAEDNGSPATLAQRAQWEAVVRMGRGNRGTISVQGWREQAGGDLWQPNRLVRVRSPMLSVDADMLIAGCSYLLDDRGTRTELTICRREAFELVAGIGASRLGQKLNDKTQREKKKKGQDWSML